MAVEDRLITLLAEHAGTDENSLSLEDPLWTGDGGFMQENMLDEFFDEIEGEFGIDFDDRDADDISTVGDLLRMVEMLVNEEIDARSPT